MLPLKYAGRWQAASIVLLLFVLGIMLAPAVWFWDDRSKIASWVASLDKWVHVVVFAGLALWFAGQYRPAAYWRIAAGLLAFGVLVEVAQRAIGYRSAEWLDVLGDLAGIIIGLLVAAAGLGGWSLRFEAWLAERRA